MPGTIRILMIEDEERHRRIYEQALREQLGATVTFAGNSATAQEALARDPLPDVVLLDLDLGGEKGEAVLQHIKKDARLHDIPVVILTGADGFDRQIRVLDLGADDFIEKGSAPEILISRLRAQIRHKMTIDRLGEMAVDRDMFASGVIDNISNIKWTILRLCRKAREHLQRDPVGEKAEVIAALEKLSEHASQLGSYASDVIQSVRETSREPHIEPQKIPQLAAWIQEFINSSAPDGQKQVTVSCAGSIAAVMADRNFLRLALLNLIHFRTRNCSQGVEPVFIISQTATGQDHRDHLGRPLLVTDIVDNCTTLSADMAAVMFDRPQHDAGLGAESGNGDFGLTLVAKVVRRMGGWIKAEPRPDGRSGTRFLLALPVSTVT